MPTLSYSENDKRRSDKLPANVKSYEESRILDFVMQRVWEAQNGKGYVKLKENYMDYRRAYNGQFKNTKDIPKWRNKLYVKLSFKTVETLRAYFDDALFGRTPYVICSPRSASFRDAAKNMEAVMQHEAEQMKKRLKYTYTINYALKYGMAVTRNFWNFQRSYKPMRQFIRTPDGVIKHFQSVEQPYTKVDSPDFIVIDPVRVAFDPLNYMLRDMRYAVEEIDTDFDALWNTKDFQGYFNLDKLENELRGGAPSVGMLTGFTANPFSDSTYTGTLGETETGSYDWTRKRVSIIRYEGKLDMPGNQEDPRYYEVYIANGRYPILIRPSPYAFDMLSYNIHNIIPQEDSAIGIGAIEPILTDQRILNILCNVRLDSLHLLLSPRLIAHKNSFERSVNNIGEVAPGGIISVKNIGELARSIMPLNMPDQGFNTFHQFWQMQNQHAEDTLAMSPNARGVMAQNQRSATEVVRSLEGAHARFLHMVNVFAETGYNDHTFKECAMIQQFMMDEKQIKITGDEQAGEQYKSIMPWDIQGDFMFERQDPTRTNKEMETQLWTGLLSTFAPYFQLLQQYGVTPIPFLRGILEASPMAQKLDIRKMLPDIPQQAQQLLGQENSRLESAIGGMGASQPGSGMPVGQPAPIPQPQGTAMGIAMGM